MSEDEFLEGPPAPVAGVTSFGEVDKIELHRLHETREIVSDEDVLSFDARAALEQVGSSVGFVLALVLLFALLPRAAMMRSRFSAPSLPSEAREARDLERRAYPPEEGGLVEPVEARGGARG